MYKETSLADVPEFVRTHRASLLAVSTTCSHTEHRLLSLSFQLHPLIAFPRTADNTLPIYLGSWKR